ncbi:hypothetical protein [Paraburkholderia youngii]|uniref:hypothetical protein n=1 Tax=Paraburkholderia youngii TaxID=2782701 RepID=UPI003D1AB106
MRRFPTMLGVLSLVASSFALAQANSPGGKSGEQGAQEVQPGKASNNMDRAAAAGGSKAASGTLMQKREKGMSPESASETGATGKMKQ